MTVNSFKVKDTKNRLKGIIEREKEKNKINEKKAEKLDELKLKVVRFVKQSGVEGIKFELTYPEMEMYFEDFVVKYLREKSVLPLISIGSGMPVDYIERYLKVIKANSPFGVILDSNNFTNKIILECAVLKKKYSFSMSCDYTVDSFFK